MAFDTKAWLINDLGYTEAEATELLPRFAGREEKLASGQLRQADYSKHMNGLKDQEAGLKATSDRLNKELAEWAEIKGADSSEAAQIRARLELVEQEKLTIQQTLERVATENGLDLKTLLPEKKVEPKVPETKTPTFDENKFVSREQLGAVTAVLLRNPAQLLAISQQHQALFGEPLPDAGPLYDKFVAAAAKDPNASLMRVWEDEFKVPEKRQEVAAAKYTADIAAAEARGAENARSQAAIPGQQAPGHNAPIFTKLGAEGGSHLQRPQAGASTRSFATSLASGKYRGSSGNPAPRH